MAEETTVTVDSVDVTNTTTQQMDFYQDDTQTTLSNDGDAQTTGDTTTDGSTDSSTTDNVDGTQGEPTVDVVKAQADLDSSDNAVKALQKDLTAKGVNFDKVVKEFEEYGALSGQTMADLAQAGYPKEVIQTFIDCRIMVEQQFIKSVYEQAGGEAEFNKIIQWAGANLPDKTVKAFNRAIDTNNLEQISLMMDGMKSRMIAKHGTAKPSILGSGTNATTSSNKGFGSKEEMVKAMSDPRYGRDAKYMREVELKMLLTQF